MRVSNNKKNSKTSLIALIGIPLLLLIASLFFTSPNEKVALNDTAVNRYYNDLPLDYVTLLNQHQNETAEKKDSINEFIPLLINEPSNRSLIILKKSPIKRDISNNFQINIYPSDKRQLSSSTPFYPNELTNNGVLYKYQGDEYVTFKFGLPLFDIESISIKQILLSKRAKFWTDTISVDNLNIETLKSKVVEKADGDKVKPNIYKPLLFQTLKEHSIPALAYSYTIDGDSLTEVTQNVEGFANNNQKSIVSIENRSLFWKAINTRGENLIKSVELLNDKNDQVKTALQSYLDNATSFDALFNTDKLATYLAITSLYTSNCKDEPLHLSFNEADGKLEPIFTQQKCIGEKSRFIPKMEINNQDFILNYIDKLKTAYNIDFKKTLGENPEILSEMALINDYYPKQSFSLDYLHINKLKIKKNLHQSTTLKAELISMDDKRMVLSVFNVSYYPIEIKGLNHKGKKQVIALNPKVEVKSRVRDTITIDLPRSFENLFVSKKSKSTGFLLHKHIYELNVEYSTIGMDEVNLVPIIPYQEKEDAGEDLFRSEKFVNKHEDILINEDNKTITFKKDSVVLSSPLVISKGYTFTLKPGHVVDIVNGGKIISHAPLNFIGTKSQPVQVISSDKKGQGLLILSAISDSQLEHVEFNNLSNPRYGAWSVTGAVTFYESPVHLNKVLIQNNRCEDALNIVRTNFTLKNSTIANTQSDAFDGDFVKGTVTNCKFNNLGNDAIDVSGSDLTITKVVISNAKDKGLSAGEDSKMTINNVEVNNSEIAVAGKDLSIVTIKGLKVIDTKLGFTAFQKKPEFGPSSITVTGLETSNIETDYLIESSSTMIVDGEKIETSENVKDRMYGVEFGRSSAETRNSQN